MRPAGSFLVVSVVVAAAPAARGADVRVQGEAGLACPRADEVAAQLEALLPAAVLPATAETRTVRMKRAGARLSLVFATAEGRVLARRELAASAACDDLAKAAAVVIASWRLELGDGLASPALPGLALPAPVLTAAAAPLPRAAPGVEVHLGVGAAVAAARGLDTRAPAAELALRAFRTGSWLGGAVVLRGVGRHAFPLGEGEAGWRRLTLTAGPTARVAARAFEGDAFVGVVAGVLSVSGASYDRDRAAAAFDPGFETRLRVGARWRRVHVWAGAGVVTWFVARHVEVVETPAPRPVVSARRLPRAEGLLSLGVDIRLGP